MQQAPGAPQRVPLDDSPGFLLSQLGVYSAQRFAERLQPLGVHPRHFGLLVNIASVEGQSQQYLADAMGIHRNVMVGLVDELEHRGLVERRRHASDRRAHALYLTAAARELLVQAEAFVHQNDTELVTALDQAERRLLISLLRRMASERGLHRGVHPGLQSPHPDA
jgi:DNA-binding MarR family transcriptional regulator